MTEETLEEWLHELRVEHRDLDDMIGRSAAITPIERPYVKLADDPRVLA